MKSYSLNNLLTAILLFSLVAVSCSRSPYRYVKVTPEPFPDKETVRTDEETRSEAPEEEIAKTGDQQESRINDQAGQDADPVEEAELPGASEEVVSVQVDREAVAAISPRPQKTKKSNSRTFRTVVHRESQKSAAYNAPPEKKHPRALGKKKLSRTMDRVAKKSSASSFSAGIFFNQWMKIGLILIVVGLIVGIAWGALGWVVTVIGLVFFILGLIQQV